MLNIYTNYTRMPAVSVGWYPDLYNRNSGNKILYL